MDRRFMPVTRIDCDKDDMSNKEVSVEMAPEKRLYTFCI